jgi:tRNA threonylcarbamoyladenosine biosynthesis protein TsaE
MTAGAEMGDASTFATSSERETADLGRAVGGLLGPGDVVFVEGPLGVGKTCLIRGACEGLGYEGRVRSPSFAVVNQYEGRCRIYHVDLYRIASDSPELEDLSRQEYFSDDVVTLIEWGEKLVPWGVRPTVTIRIRIVEDDRRRIEVEAANPRLARGVGEIRLK